MTDRSHDTDHEKADQDRAEAPQRVTETHAPAGAPVAIDAENRSDANDGVERPLGFFSSQAQADRNADHPGETSVNEVAGGPGFYSPEQQAARNAPDDDAALPTPVTHGDTHPATADTETKQRSDASR